MDLDSKVFGVYFAPIDATEQEASRRWSVLRESDHLLRRFGECEVLFMEPGQNENARLRPVADELWCVLEGEVDLHLEDQRDDSDRSREIDIHQCQIRCPEVS